MCISCILSLGLSAMFKIIGDNAERNLDREYGIMNELYRANANLYVYSLKMEEVNKFLAVQNDELRNQIEDKSLEQKKKPF